MRKYRGFILDGLEIVEAPDWVPKDKLNKISESRFASTPITPQYVDTFMNFAIDRMWEAKVNHGPINQKETKNTT